MKKQKQLTVKPVVMFALGLLPGMAVGVLVAWLMWGPRYVGGLKCLDGSRPDENGCCVGETYEQVDGLWACCPSDGNDCFEPIK